MTLARTHTVALVGLVGYSVDVEVDISDGLPSYILLGLPDAALNESRERVRSALINSGFTWPNRKVTVSLSPAWLPKSGSSYDLPIAIALLAAQNLIAPPAESQIAFFGELGLDGQVRGVRGTLPAVLAARENGCEVAIISAQNYQESKSVHGIKVIPVSSLLDVIHFLATGEIAIPEASSDQLSPVASVDLSDVAGQIVARESLEIAAIGGHHLLFMGPPGTGKTMLAERIPTILPLLTDDEALEVAAISSIAGTNRSALGISHIPPFVAPHHSTTPTAMVGGGSHGIRPGAVSLAHQGILFIDEAPECAQGVLDSLRQPLESGTVTISRSLATVTFPSRFILVLAANPCPCGKFSGRGRSCTCSSLQIRRYLQKISGPLLDRIDIKVFVEAPTRIEMASTEPAESSEIVRARVIAARAVAAARFKEEHWSLNSEIPATALRKRFAPDKSGMNYLHQELDHERLSARGFHKAIRLAWSIADMSGHPTPQLEDIKRAITLRSGMDFSQ